MEQIAFILFFIIAVYIAIPMILFLISFFIGILAEIFNNTDLKKLQNNIFTKKLYYLLIKFYPFLR